MDIYLENIERHVKIDDSIAQEYLKYKDIQESTFTISAYFSYPDGLADLSDRELSHFCNRVLVEDLETACSVAIATQFIGNAKDMLAKEGWKITATEQ